MKNYSSAEEALFIHFDVIDIIDNVTIMLVYSTVMIYRAFLNPELYDVRYIEALRQALKFLEKRGNYRLTTEFDAVIMNELMKN